MIADITFLKNEYGLNYFSLVHDMYTIDRKKVVAFCEDILASGESLPGAAVLEPTALTSYWS